MNERLPYLRHKTQQLTTSPGVYLMRDKTGKIIYVGKAKNLKNRVTSYFRENPDHTPKVAKMVSNVYEYDFIVTDSEYEALVLECSLIKQYNPKYNILLKDDKGYHYIKISDEEYPKITAVKQKDNNGTFLGPYTSSYTANQAVNEANKVFMLPTCKKKFPQEFKKTRPCLNFHIKQCMGVCQGKISSELYRQTVNEAVEYIKNGSTMSVDRLTEDMLKASDNLDFEKAAILRDRINAIKHAADTQKIFSDIKDTDVIAIAHNEQYCCTSVINYRHGKLYDKSVFFLGESDNNMLEDFIIQFYQNKEKIPREILLAEEIPNMVIVEQLLRDKSGHAVHFSVGQRGNPLKLVNMAKNNAVEYLSFKVGRTGKEILALEELGKILGLPEPPRYIESYDISNLASSAIVAGMVVFENGRPLKSAYKRFSMKEVQIQNDYACMREVLERRFKHYFAKDDEGFSRLPDLILLDGGKGQVNAVEPILRQMGIYVPIFGMVKDNKHRTRAIATGGSEISVSDNKQAFFLLTRIQDEVHRFSITYQRKLHSKNSFSMELTKVKGIGDKKAMKIITTFKTREALKNATVEEIAKTAGVGSELAGKVHDFIQNEL